MRIAAIFFLLIVSGLVLQTAEAHADFWSADCISHVCCSDGDPSSPDKPFSSDTDDENMLCHPFDACHSCLHIAPEVMVMNSFKICNLFSSPIWQIIAPDRDMFPYEGPPPK